MTLRGHELNKAEAALWWLDRKVAGPVEFCKVEQHLLGPAWEKQLLDVPDGQSMGNLGLCRAGGF